MKWHSTHENDKWIAEVFDYKFEGYFVEIGACSGLRNSSCYSLETYLNWNGIAVEPHTKYFEECKIYRKNAVNACIYTFDGNIQYTECTGRIEDRNWAAEGLSGITIHLRDHHKKYHTTYGKVVNKKSISPKTLLESYNAPAAIDYVGIDTEGSEFEILKAWPWDLYIVLLISVEADNEDITVITDFLKTKNYTKVKNPYCNVHYEQHYCHNSFLDRYKFEKYE